MSSSIKLYLVVVAALLAFSPYLSAQSEQGRIPGKLIVRLQETVSPAGFAQNLSSVGRAPGAVRVERQLGSRHNIHLLAYDPGRISDEEVLLTLRSHPEVIAVQYDYEIELRQMPDDPFFGEQWDSERIGLPAVWEETTGGLTARGDTIVVAILDSGFNIAHPELAGNIWRNSGELPGDGIDNDDNGYVDDLSGWNFKDTSAEHRLSSHGHQVAGIIGAKGNNGLGIAGINWSIKLMLFDLDRVSQIVAAYDYVIDQRDRYNRSGGAAGAFVVATNASIGQSFIFCEDQPVWGGMYDLLGEVGVLTGAGTSNSNYNVEQQGDMPTSCTSDFILTVLNTDMDDEKYPSSAFGKVSIDMGAPGDRSGSIGLYEDFSTFDDNSAAAPHLTGAIALLYSLPCPTIAEDALSNPRQTALFIREALLNGVDPLENLAELTATGGRLNVANAMEIIGAACGGSMGDLDILNVYPNPTNSELNIEFETPDYEAYTLRIFNALGQLMFRDEFQPSRFSKKYEIPVADWAPGTYVVMLGKGKNVVNRKFVVHRSSP